MNKKILFIASLAVATAFSCTPASAEDPLKPSAFKQKMDKETNEILLDVRTPEEYNEAHLPSAKNINWFDADFEQQASKLDKSKPVFVYCKSGGRSGKATAKLQSMGFKNVYDMQGGITAWKNEGLPLDK